MCVYIYIYIYVCLSLSLSIYIYIYIYITKSERDAKTARRRNGKAENDRNARDDLPAENEYACLKVRELP